MPLSGRKGSRRRKCYIQVDCILFLQQWFFIEGYGGNIYMQVE